MNNTNVFKTAGEMISNMNDTQLFNLDVNSFLNDVDKSLNKPQPHKPANKPHSLSGMGNSVFGTMKGMFDQNTGFNFPKTTTTQTSTHNDYLKRGTNGTSPNAYSPSVFGKKSKHTDWSEPSYTPLPGSINENSPFGYEVKTAIGTPSYKTDITPTVLNLSEDEKPLQLVKASDKKWIDFTSDILTAASFIPGLDTVTNLLSIPVDIAKGDWVSAGFDLLGAIPIAGEPADLAKVGIKAGKTLDKASDAARVAKKIKYPGNSPSISPGKGFVWRGTSAPEQGLGNWYNPQTHESWHADLHHPGPIGPHWDYIDSNGIGYRVFSDGRVEMK